MNPEIKAQWIAALRSGKYKQGRGALRTDTVFSSDSPVVVSQYCCLGVLCELAAEAGIVQRGEGGTGPLTHMSVKYDGVDGALPGPVRKWAGLPSSGVEFAGGTDVHFQYFQDRSLATVSAVAMNDQYKMTFDQIADVIEHFA